jgi:hypothetical protein
MTAYSFREAYETGAFGELDLITAENYGREAKKRQVDLSFGRRLYTNLEALDEAGAVCPIAFADPTAEALIFREEVPFAPWETYAVDELGTRRPQPFYSPWQLLYLKEAVELGQVQAPVEWLLNADEIAKLSKDFIEFHRLQDLRRRALDQFSRPIVLLLVRLQNRYLPSVRGTLTKLTTHLVYDPELHDYVSPHEKTVLGFQPDVVLREVGLTPEAIKNIHQRLCVLGVQSDSLKAFYMLFRMAPHPERSKLLGGARRAQDAYDAAEVLRRFYHDLTGELLPTCDEIFDLTGGRWKEELFGHPPTLAYNRHDLRTDLIRHHLYPHTVHLVVEGETDELLFRSLLEALGGPVPNQGVTFSTLEGTGKTRLYINVLSAMKTYARWPILVADREGDIERDVARMKKEGLLSDAVVLWHRSIEEDNFSDEELVAAASHIAERKGVELKLDARTLRQKYESLRDRVGKDARGIGRLLLELARHPDRGAVVISKGELVEELTTLILNELAEQKEEAALIEKRPLLDLVFKIVRAT